MALWVCAACTCRYSVGAPCCPQCRSTLREGEQMAKIRPDGHVSYEPGREPPGPVRDGAAEPAPESQVPAPGPGQDQDPAPPDSPEAPKAKTTAPTLSRAPKRDGTDG